MSFMFDPIYLQIYNPVSAIKRSFPRQISILSAFGTIET